MKLDEIRDISAPLLSIFFLMNGIGLLSTLIPIRLELVNISCWDVGLVTAGYYVGMIFGAFRNASFILRVGYVRAYAVFAFFIGLAALTQGLHYSFYLWIFLRLTTGYCLSGLYIVVESWMLKSCSHQTRGRFLAFYMICIYAGMALGQILVTLFPIETLLPFSAVSILIAISIIPVLMGKKREPSIKEPAMLNLGQLFRLSPSGILSCFSSGLTLSSVFGLLPLYLQLEIDIVRETATIMFFLILGGTVLQFPIGHLSDYMDRRKVLLGLNTAVIVLSIVAVLLPKDNFIAWYCLIFIFGGASFLSHPVSISHTCDSISHNEVVPAAQGLTLAFGVGAAMSPILASVLMESVGSSGLFLYFIIISAGVSAYLGYRIKVHEPPSLEDHEEFIPFPITTPIATELEPRIDSRA